MENYINQKHVKQDDHNTSYLDNTTDIKNDSKILLKSPKPLMNILIIGFLSVFLIFILYKVSSNYSIKNVPNTASENSTIQTITTPTLTETVNTTPKPTEEKYKNVKFIESDRFKVNIVDGNDETQKYTISILDKLDGSIHLISEAHYFWASVLPHSEQDSDYVFFSSGSGVSRSGSVISLKNNKYVADNFTTTGGSEFFYKNYLIFNAPNTAEACLRPWESGSATEIRAIKLTDEKSNEIIFIRKADNLNDYNIRSVENNILHLKNTKVDSCNDWNSLAIKEQTEDVNLIELLK